MLHIRCDTLDFHERSREQAEGGADGKINENAEEQNTSYNTYVDDLNFLASSLHALHNVGNYIHIFRGFSILNLFQSQQQRSNFFVIYISSENVERANEWMDVVHMLLAGKFIMHTSCFLRRVHRITRRLKRGQHEAARNILREIYLNEPFQYKRN